MSLTTSLVSYYKMDETTGTTVADAVGSNDLTASGTNIVTGKINNCRSFNWSSDKIPLPTLWLWNSVTINMWIKMDNVTNDQRSCYNNDSENKFFIFGVRNSKLRLYSYSSWTIANFEGNTTISTWTWYMATYVFNASWTCRIYLNWNADWTGACWPFADLGTQFWQYLWAGRLWNSEFFDGLMDEVAFYNRELTSTEISELYNSWNWNQYPFASVNYTNFFRMF